MQNMLQSSSWYGIMIILVVEGGRTTDLSQQLTLVMPEAGDCRSRSPEYRRRAGVRTQHIRQCQTKLHRWQQGYVYHLCNTINNINNIKVDIKHMEMICKMLLLCLAFAFNCTVPSSVCSNSCSIGFVIPVLHISDFK